MVIVYINKNGPTVYTMGPLHTANTIRNRPTLTPVTARASALAGLTALFGMGRGGHRRYRHLNVFIIVLSTQLSGMDGPGCTSNPEILLTSGHCLLILITK